jgi:hypothetical protein
MPEAILFQGQKTPGIVWFNPDGEFCLLFDSTFIIIDRWHYPEIDD